MSSLRFLPAVCGFLAIGKHRMRSPRQDAILYSTATISEAEFIDFHAVEIGELGDIAILEVGAIALGSEVINVAKDLSSFFQVATQAKNGADLDRAPAKRKQLMAQVRNISREANLKLNQAEEKRVEVEVGEALRDLGELIGFNQIYPFLCFVTMPPLRITTKC